MWAKILLLFFVFSFLFRTDLSFDQDLGRHIRLGEIIWQTHQVPKTNFFSYTNPDFPFINTHWLFEVWAYVLSKFPGGVEGLLVRKVVIILGAVFLILKIVPKQNSTLLLPVSFIFLHVLRERIELRPEIFSFLFTATTLAILERFLKQKTKWLYLLPFIHLIWINTHIYSFVGLVLQAIYLVHLSYQYLRFKLEGLKLKLLSIIFILSVLLSLINPNGLAGFLYPLNVIKNYGYTIVENQTMFFLENIKFRDPNFLFVKFSLGLTLLGLLVAFLKRKFELKNILLTLMGAGLALYNVRSFPYLVFLGLPATLQNFNFKSNRITQMLTTLAAILLILESYFYLNGDYYKYNDSGHQVGLKLVESVKGAMDFVLVNDLPGPIYNNFDIGSYIIYRGYPNYKVFIDGRPEAYPKEFLQEVYIPTQYDYNKFKTLEEKYQFKTIIFSHTDQTPWGKTFLQNLLKDPSWKLLYIDEFTIVSTKLGVAESKKLAAIDLANLSPNNYNYTDHLSYLRIGLFLLSNGYQTSAKEFILRDQQIFSQDPISNQILGNPVSNYFFW